jgi:hypothetical protein
VRQQLGSKQNWSDSDDLCVMFKGAYSDTFYRAIRDALHVEVDSWKQGVSLHVHELEQLWRIVDALEPISRNADATELARTEKGAAHCDSQARSRIIPLQGLLTRVGDA